MECLAAEKNKSLMRMLADTMSTVAQETWGTKDKWMGILESMHKFITSNDPHLIEVSLVLFSKLTEWLGQDPVMQNMQRQMYDILLRFLQDAPNDDIRIAACKATTNFIGVRPLPTHATHALSHHSVPCVRARKHQRKPRSSSQTRLVANAPPLNRCKTRHRAEL